MPPFNPLSTMQVVFQPGDVRPVIVTCGGLCPGINTVIRELVVCLRREYGVETVYGVQVF